MNGDAPLREQISLLRLDLQLSTEMVKQLAVAETKIDAMQKDMDRREAALIKELDAVRKDKGKMKDRLVVLETKIQHLEARLPDAKQVDLAGNIVDGDKTEARRAGRQSGLVYTWGSLAVAAFLYFLSWLFGSPAPPVPPLIGP